MKKSLVVVFYFVAIMLFSAFAYADAQCDGKSNGWPCDNGDATICTGVCMDEVCTGGWTHDMDGVPCEQDDNVCDQEQCQVGLCVHNPDSMIGFPCADEDPSNECTDDKCGLSGDSGVCLHTANTLSCHSDGIFCTIDHCVDKICEHDAPLAEDLPCTDSDNTICTEGRCRSGLCASVTDWSMNDKPCEDDGIFCTFDECRAGICAHDPLIRDGQDCAPDDSACTVDKCYTGICTHTIDCNDGDSCTSDVCVGTSCVHTQRTDPQCLPEFNNIPTIILVVFLCLAVVYLVTRNKKK